MTQPNKAKKKLIELSFISNDKSIHFGKLHVVYIRDALTILEELQQQHEEEIKKERARTDRFLNKTHQLAGVIDRLKIENQQLKSKIEAIKEAIADIESEDYGEWSPEVIKVLEK